MLFLLELGRVQCVNPDHVACAKILAKNKLPKKLDFTQPFFLIPYPYEISMCLVEHMHDVWICFISPASIYFIFIDSKQHGTTTDLVVTTTSPYTSCWYFNHTTIKNDVFPFVYSLSPNKSPLVVSKSVTVKETMNEKYNKPISTTKSHRSFFTTFITLI